MIVNFYAQISFCLNIKEINKTTNTKYVVILKQHTNALKKEKKETRMEKDPHILLVALTMMLITSPSFEIDYHSCLCGGMIQMVLLWLVG